MAYLLRRVRPALRIPREAEQMHGRPSATIDAPPRPPRPITSCGEGSPSPSPTPAEAPACPAGPACFVCPTAMPPQRTQGEDLVEAGSDGRVGQDAAGAVARQEAGPAAEDGTGLGCRLTDRDLYQGSCPSRSARDQIGHFFCSRRQVAPRTVGMRRRTSPTPRRQVFSVPEPGAPRRRRQAGPVRRDRSPPMTTGRGRGQSSPRPLGAAMCSAVRRPRARRSIRFR